MYAVHHCPKPHYAAHACILNMFGNWGRVILNICTADVWREKAHDMGLTVDWQFKGGREGIRNERQFQEMTVR